MAKKKIRLTDDQKRWYENLEAFLSLSPVKYYLPNVNLKECVLDGPFACLSEDPPIFDVIVCTDSHDAAKIVVKWFLTGSHLVVDLRGHEPKVVYSVWERREP